MKLAFKVNVVVRAGLMLWIGESHVARLCLVEHPYVKSKEHAY